MTTSNPDTTAKPAPAGVPPGASPAPAPGAASAAEPTLKERSSELAAVARAEQAKLRAREKERAERVALEARAKAAEEKAARLEALEKELETDALGVLSKRGVKARDIAERVVKEGTPDGRIEALEKELRERDERDAKKQKELEAQLAERQRKEAYEAARTQLHKTFNEMRDKLPLLSKLCTTEARTEREYMAAYMVFANDPETASDLAAGRITDVQIFEAMETAKASDRDAFLEGSDADVLEKVLTSKRASGTGTEKASSGSVRQGTENASGSGAKTLTNGQAASRASTDEEFDIRPGETLAQADARQNRMLAEKHGWGRRR